MVELIQKDIFGGLYTKVVKRDEKKRYTVTWINNETKDRIVHLYNYDCKHFISYEKPVKFRLSAESCWTWYCQKCSTKTSL